MFRAGLRMVLSSGIPNAEFIEAHSLADAMTVPLPAVNLILLDIILKDPLAPNGLDVIAALRKHWPQAPVLVLSSQDDAQTAKLALMLGASGFVSKAEAADEIIAIVLRHLQRPLSATTLPPNTNALKRLTPRQLEVLTLLHKGLSNKLIAHQLSLSDNTVRRHVQDILEFFEVASRAEAVFAARSQGLVD
jgi:DNA-binding NarL/FixJ family response regulator